MSNKDIFSFDPFKREIDEQLDTPFNNAGIMSKDVSSDIEEAEDSTYDPFSFVDRFAKDLVSLFDENEEDKEKLKNTYMVDTKSDRLAARDTVLDEFVADYNAAFERGRPLTEASTIETLPLPPIGEADPLRKTVRDALRSSDSSSSGVPVPQKTDPVLAGFMPFSDTAALDAVRGFLGAATNPSNTEFVKRGLINVVEGIGKKVDPNNFATKLGDFATSVGNAVDTATSTPAKLMLQDLLLPDFSKGFFTVNENYFSEDEIAALRQLARKKGEGIIYKGDYKDVTIGDVWGANEKSVVTGGLTMGDRLYNSLGRTKIAKDKETGEYYIVDTYDFNLYVDYTQGPINPKTGRRKGKTYTAEEFENSLSTGEELLKTLTSDASLFEIAHNVAFLFGSRDYKGTDRDTGRKVRINLGDLKGSPDSAPMPRARPAGLMTRTS